jgi:hypothetical protein
MNHLRRIFLTAPVTTVYLLSSAGFMLAATLAPNRAVQLVFFYLLAIPSYVVGLVSVALAVSLGVTPTWWIAPGLCVVVDAVIVVATGRLRTAGDTDRRLVGDDGTSSEGGATVE